MRAFAALLDRLLLMPARNGKLKLMADYFATTPDPDRGYGLAALAGDLAAGMLIDAVVQPRLNEWNGRINVEVEIQDVRVRERNV